jgi:hypothetical protein
MDYDCVTERFIIREAQELARVFNLQFDIWESSPRHYHIRCEAAMPKAKALEIINYSRCSPDYKSFCEKVGCFPIRTEIKKVYKNGKHVMTSPKPKRIMTIGKNESM